jgi:hypothetical protein
MLNMKKKNSDVTIVLFNTQGIDLLTHKYASRVYFRVNPYPHAVFYDVLSILIGRRTVFKVNKDQLKTI